MILLYVSVQKKGPGSQGRAGMAKSSAVCLALIVLCDLQTLALATPSEKCSDGEGLQSSYCSWSEEPWRALASGKLRLEQRCWELRVRFSPAGPCCPGDPRAACLPLGTEGPGRADDQA